MRIGSLGARARNIFYSILFHTKHINTLCGQKVELLNVKLVVHVVTTGLYKVNINLQAGEPYFLKTPYVLVLSALKRL
jgi:hypothetical protein